MFLIKSNFQKNNRKALKLFLDSAFNYKIRKSREWEDFYINSINKKNLNHSIKVLIAMKNNQKFESKFFNLNCNIAGWFNIVSEICNFAIKESTRDKVMLEIANDQDILDDYNNEVATFILEYIINYINKKANLNIIKEVRNS